MPLFLHTGFREVANAKRTIKEGVKLRTYREAGPCDLNITLFIASTQETVVELIEDWLRNARQNILGWVR